MTVKQLQQLENEKKKKKYLATPTNPKNPLKNSKRESIIQYMIAHPTANNEDLGKKFQCKANYFAKLKTVPDFVERMSYLQQKRSEKITSVKGIWTAQQLILKIQDRISNPKTTTGLFLQGASLLGKYLGIERIAISHNIESIQTIKMALSIKAQEVPVPENEYEDTVTENKSETQNAV